MGPPIAPIRRLSDRDLIAACLQNDQEAWRELVSRYQRLVYSIPYRYGLPGFDCDDVFQTVFLALFESLGKIEDRQRVPKWLMTTTHRAAWDLLRIRGLPAEVAGLALEPEEPPGVLAARWEMQQELRQSVRQLGGRCRHLLEALFLEDPRPGYDQIARRLGVPTGSIGPSRQRCLDRLLGVVRSRGVRLEDL